MYDLELTKEILKQISHALHTVITRFEPIKSVNDFTSSPSGLEKLDSICMQLIVIGESIKNIDKVTGKRLLLKYPEIEWKKVMGLRDIITHHYVDINADAIFDVCQNKIRPLFKTINKILTEL